MKHLSRFVFIAAVLVMAAIFVLPVSADRLPSAAVFQSPTDIPTLSPTATPITPQPTATDTPVPPQPTATNTLAPLPTATNTLAPLPTATNTLVPLPTATNTLVPLPTATNTLAPLPTATLYPTYVPTYPPPPPSYTIIGYWTVQPGQTLYCIGRYYQVSPWAIAYVNYIPWPYFIYPGQVLAIPNAPWYNIPPGPVCYPGVPNITPTPVPTITPTLLPGVTPTPTPTPVPATCRYYHYVQWGQTLSGIAWYYGTTIQAIMYANPFITNPNLIYAGSTLCIP